MSVLVERPFQRSGRSEVYASNGMCATSHPLAARIAVETLQAGGNAVDAGVAAAFALTMCEPGMTGLGGDCFALYAPPGGGDVVALNGSGRAPAGIDADALRRAQSGDAMPLYGAAAATTPGAVAGLCRLVADHGRLDLARLLAPAIALAEDGAPVAPRSAWDWARTAHVLNPAAKRHLLKGGDAPYAAGDVFRAPGLAEVMRKIASEGASGFYEGPVAEDIIGALRADGGAHTLDDFAATAPEYVAPLSTTYAGKEIVVPPPNSQGAAALLMMDVLTRLPLDDLDPAGADRIHLETEAAKLAYDARDRLLADPALFAESATRLRDPAIAAALAQLIDPDAALTLTALNTAAAAVHENTVLIVTVDRDGGALSLLVSLFHVFGSGLASEAYGVLLHNRGAGFTLRPGHPNEVAPGKRPLHTLMAGLVRDGGQTCATYGVMGGQYQAAGHARLLTDLLRYGRPLQPAIDAPRSFPEKGVLRLEAGHDPLTITHLAGKGHVLDRAPSPHGGAQMIWIDAARGVLVGASDPRKDGVALGY